MSVVGVEWGSGKNISWGFRVMIWDYILCIFINDGRDFYLFFEWNIVY